MPPKVPVALAVESADTLLSSIRMAPMAAFIPVMELFFSIGLIPSGKACPLRSPPRWSWSMYS